MQQYDPDLVLQELGKRFRGLGGGRMAAAVAGAFLLIWLWSIWFTVQAEETGIISTSSRPKIFRISSATSYLVQVPLLTMW